MVECGDLTRYAYFLFSFLIGVTFPPSPISPIFFSISSSFSGSVSYSLFFLAVFSLSLPLSLSLDVVHCSPPHLLVRPLFPLSSPSSRVPSASSWVYTLGTSIFVSVVRSAADELIHNSERADQSLSFVVVFTELRRAYARLQSTYSNTRAFDRADCLFQYMT